MTSSGEPFRKKQYVCSSGDVAAHISQIISYDCRKFVFCPDCGAVLHLKFQVDDSLDWRIWPVILECLNCHSIIEAEFSKDEDGLTASRNIDGRRGPDLKKAEVRSDGWVIGYCDLLPTPEPLYYKPYAMGLCMPSIFMYFDLELMMKYRPLSKDISDCIVRYRHAMPMLYAVLRGEWTNDAILGRR